MNLKTLNSLTGSSVPISSQCLEFTSGEKLGLALDLILAINDVRIYLNGLGRGRLTDSWQLV